MWAPLFYWYAKTTETSVTPMVKLYINCSVGRVDNSLHHWTAEEQQGATRIFTIREHYGAQVQTLFTWILPLHKIIIHLVQRDADYLSNVIHVHSSWNKST